jgi:hypothetical protein
MSTLWDDLHDIYAVGEVILNASQGLMKTETDKANGGKPGIAWPALWAGVGFFVLGCGMLAFSVFEPIADAAEKALGVAADPAGAAVGKRPLLRRALTAVLP